MSTNPSELFLFSEFVAGKLRSDSEMTPEQCLQLWRAEYPTSSEYEENVRVIQGAIDEMQDGGNSVDGDELHSQLRSKYSKAE